MYDYTIIMPNGRYREFACFDNKNNRIWVWFDKEHPTLLDMNEGESFIIITDGYEAGSRDHRTYFLQVPTYKTIRQYTVKEGIITLEVELKFELSGDGNYTNGETTLKKWINNHTL